MIFSYIQGGHRCTNMYNICAYMCLKQKHVQMGYNRLKIHTHGYTYAVSNSELICDCQKDGKSRSAWSP